MAEAAQVVDSAVATPGEVAAAVGPAAVVMAGGAMAKEEAMRVVAVRVLVAAGKAVVAQAAVAMEERGFRR